MCGRGRACVRMYVCMYVYVRTVYHETQDINDRTFFLVISFFFFFFLNFSSHIPSLKRYYSNARFIVNEIEMRKEKQKKKKQKKGEKRKKRY